MHGLTLAGAQALVNDLSEQIEDHKAAFEQHLTLERDEQTLRYRMQRSLARS